VDGRAEITAPDRDLARMLLRLGRPISLAVNKAIPARAKTWRTISIRSASATSFPFPPSTASASMPCSIM
jgi:hypothetical protein